MTSRAVLTYKAEIDVHDDVKQALKWQVFIHVTKMQYE